MLNITADQINLTNLPKFQERLQSIISEVDSIIASELPREVLAGRVASLLNGK